MMQGMDFHILEWLNLITRWLHVIIGIAWIGGSFYFNWLENQLNREPRENKEGRAGHLWAIHGGGFYYLEKFKLAPAEIPKKLHWFKYEAYFTWVTGFCLLAIVYYFNANSQLIDPRVQNLSSLTAISIGIGTLLLGWIFYDLLCRSSVGRKNKVMAAILTLFTAVVAYALCQVFSARGAYIHVGAMLGTIMAANVFFVIIPSQKAMVDAAIKGEDRDPKLGANALQRSRHNNYFTLPVLFVMISHHFPSTYGHQWNWAILMALVIISVAVRHYFNVRHQPNKSFWVIPGAIVGLIALAIVTAPPERNSVKVGLVAFDVVQEIIKNRCLQCHSDNPTDDVFKVAPNNVIFSTPQQIKKWADRIKVRSVDQDTMPLLNKTKMTEEERVLLGQWVQNGAQVKP